MGYYRTHYASPLLDAAPGVVQVRAGRQGLPMTGVRNWLWRLRTYAARRLSKMPVIGGTFSHWNNRLFARQFTPDLQQLHDVLEGTELAGRYWVWAGMLLGWAREGALLAHDRDADFGIVREDLSRVLSAVPVLRRAGFRPLMQFRNNLGEVTEITFRKHGAKFEFFVFEPVDDMLRYYVYGGPTTQPIEIEGRLPKQELVPFEFVGRTWLRHDDFDRELACAYGDWRTPQTDWNYLTDDLATVDQHPWKNTDTSWPS